ncbi:hypothetical protein Skr01_75650 [Sphaerisporangium krabiense]|uniref:tRNA A37 threonylcarbamoyladenosine biosynthesis protein TsaE n=1 Tax=Sphaerisporangium krabiense TaxID=763782 RepID=A0A7W8Z289_9ACTN|nr:NACHT domain-containing protein [Sphaerisporangium krabiense]MBB5626116.1 tRNA A37 threonylcarbamoyladenosine biosynthesis protein TsaE [Sphaerisporangium krabiense]GII67480.1 hypothetical protein Skr01_75650 [Sphaerisporangium krabiense]
MTTPRNPFSAHGTSSMEEHVMDSALLAWTSTTPTAGLPAARRLARLVDRYLSDAGRRGSAVFLHGDHGSGKTHAVRYALSRHLADGNGAIRLYAKAETVDLLSVYQRLMSQLSRPLLRELTVRFRGVLAVDRAKGTPEESVLIDAARRDPEQVPALYREMLVEPGAVLEAQADHLARVADDGADFERALDALLDPNLEQAAYDWLVGRDIALATASRLGVEGPILDSARCRFGLQLLAAMCSVVGRPLIIVIDQCERLILRHGGRPHTANLGLLHSLVERVPAERGMLILIGSESAWDALPPDLAQRFGPFVLATSALTLAEAEKLLGVYFAAAPGVPRLDREAIAHLLQVSGGNHRRLLQLCWEMYNRTGATGGPELTPATRDSAGPAVEAELRGAGLEYTRQEGRDGIVEYTVAGRAGSGFLVKVVEALFDAPSARAALGPDAPPAHTIVVVLNYASPEAVGALDAVVDAVVVFRGPEDRARLARALPRAVPTADEAKPRRTRRLGFLSGATVGLVASLGVGALANFMSSSSSAIARLGIIVGLLAAALGAEQALLWVGRYRRTRRYFTRLRASLSYVENYGLITQGEFALESSQVFVDVRLRRLAGPLDPEVAATDAPATHEVSLRDLVVRRRSGVIVVLGGPGSGKTTLLRQIVLDLIRPRVSGLPRGRLPMLLSLRDQAPMILRHDAPSLPALMASAGDLDRELCERHLSRDRAVLLFDGLDEVAEEEDRRRLVDWISGQVARYPGNLFVLTSRPAGYASNPLPSAEVVGTRPWDADEMSAFLRRWYRAVEIRAHDRSGREVLARADAAADGLITRLLAAPSLATLAASPLLLTMIANVHRYRAALPGSRAALYAEMCALLLYRRQEGKNLGDPTGLRGSQKEQVIQSLALHMMRERLASVSAGVAAAVIRRPLDRVSGAEIGAEDFLREMGRAGLLLEPAPDVYTFAHFTLQEYLAAAAIRQDPALVHLLLDGVDDPWWRETTLIWAASGDATPVIERCMAVATVPALSLAFACADEASQVEPAVRTRLGELLTSEVSDDPERRRLLSAVLVDRELGERIRLDEGTVLCLRPVSRRLYRRFVDEHTRQGRHFADPEPGGGAATGMWSTDAQRFVGWVNALSDASPRFRLPTRREVSSVVDSVIAQLVGNATIWMTYDVNRPALWGARGTPWPYGPGPDLGATLGDLLLPHLRPLWEGTSHLSPTPLDAALRTVIAAWTAETPGTATPASFGEFAESRLREALGRERPAEDPVAVLETLDAPGEPAVASALKLIRPVLDRSVPFSEERVALAVADLLPLSLSVPSRTPAARDLARVIVALVTLVQRHRGGFQPNEVLLLAVSEAADGQR